MAKEIITEELVGPGSPLIGATLLSGEDMPKFGPVVFDSADDAIVVRSLRLPNSLYEAAREMNHPAGFSGVVRDALAAHLNPSQDDIRHALGVIEAALNQKAA